MAMDGTEAELYQRMRLAYERDDKFLINNWRILPSTLRLEIMLRAFRDGKKEYISMEHFDIYSDDLKIIKDAKAEYIQELGLSEDTVRELFWWYKPKSSINMQSENVNRNLAITAKLREYIELAQKYPALTPEMIQNNPNLLKCDSRRTESRLCFLTDLNQGNLPTGDNLAIPLSFNSIVFCLKYQKKLIESLALIEKDSDMYKTIMALDEVVPDESNDKFWEKYLRLIYGDRTVEKEIARKENINKTVPLDATITPSEENSTQTIDELAYDALPVDENYGGDGDGNSPNSDVKPNQREKLDEEKIAKTLSELQKMGIKCDGYITSSSGVHAIDQENVKFYVLRKESVLGFVVLEPFGQVGNRTILLEGVESIEKLKEVVIDNTTSDLVRKRTGIRLRHDRTENQEYEYSGINQKLQNIFTLLEEFSQHRYANMSFAAVKKTVTTLIPRGEIPQASSYLRELLRKVFPITKGKDISKDPVENRNKNELGPHQILKIAGFATKKGSQSDDAEEVDI